jgi:hypothetical protein
MRAFLASMCVVTSLLFSGCGPVPVTPNIGRPMIYAFSTPGCLGCVRDKPRLDQLERGGFTVFHINILAQPELRKRYNINAVPFYVVYVGNCVVLRTHDLNLVIQRVQNGSSV